MVRALRLAGCTRVYATDVANYGVGQDEALDFLTGEPTFTGFTHLITNPPFGKRMRLADAFVVRGLEWVVRTGATLVLLLPTDFDAAVKRRRFFRDCPLFDTKIIITGRITWFERTDGERAAPKENSAFYVWRPRAERPPALLYAPARASAFAVRRPVFEVVMGGAR
jgi:hypothetical protein